MSSLKGVLNSEPQHWLLSWQILLQVTACHAEQGQIPETGTAKENHQPALIGGIGKISSTKSVVSEILLIATPGYEIQAAARLQNITAACVKVSAAAGLRRQYLANQCDVWTLQSGQD